jgi:hypothetical protein
MARRLLYSKRAVVPTSPLVAAVGADRFLRRVVGGFPMAEPSVRFDDVEVLRDSGLALLCLIRGKHVWVPKAQLLSGSCVMQPGDRGTVVVPEWFALDQGLT